MKRLSSFFLGSLFIFPFLFSFHTVLANNPQDVSLVTPEQVADIYVPLFQAEYEALARDFPQLQQASEKTFASEELYYRGVIGDALRVLKFSGETSCTSQMLFTYVRSWILAELSQWTEGGLVRDQERISGRTEFQIQYGLIFTAHEKARCLSGVQRAESPTGLDLQQVYALWSEIRDEVVIDDGGFYEPVVFSSQSSYWVIRRYVLNTFGGTDICVKAEGEKALELFSEAWMYSVRDHALVRLLKNNNSIKHMFYVLGEGEPAWDYAALIIVDENNNLYGFWTWHVD